MIIFADLTKVYLKTAIIHGTGYDKVNSEFNKLGIKIVNKNSLHLNLLTPNSSITSIFSGSSLSTPALYALVNLNPFIISGIKSNAYNELEKYKDEYTAGYIKDKAKMFESALNNSKNLGAYFSDKETGITINQTQDFNGIFDEYHFGTNSNDTIVGIGTKSGDNKIYALAGNDTYYSIK